MLRRQNICSAAWRTVRSLVRRQSIPRRAGDREAAVPRLVSAVVATGKVLSPVQADSGSVPETASGHGYRLPGGQSAVPDTQPPLAGPATPSGAVQSIVEG